MYNLDLKVISVEEKKDYEASANGEIKCYAHGLVNKGGWYTGSLTLAEKLEIGDLLSIVVFVNVAAESERNARDGYCGKGEYA